MLLNRSLRRRRLVPVAALLALAGCSDAATRVAYDIESGIEKLEPRDGARADIRHAPRSWPEGCSGSYTLRIEKGAAVNLGNGNFRTAENSGNLSVQCYGDDGNPHRWHTTYHLRFVDVPATVEVTKQAGEAAVIQTQRVAGKPIVAGVR
jgi:hypothetical protein